MISLAFGCSSYYLLVLTRGTERSYVILQALFLWAAAFLLYDYFISSKRLSLKYFLAAIFISLGWFSAHMLHSMLPVALLLVTIFVWMEHKLEIKELAVRLFLVIIAFFMIYTSLAYSLCWLMGDYSLIWDLYIHKFLTAYAVGNTSSSILEKLLGLPNILEDIYYTFCAVSVKDPEIQNHFDEWIPLMPMINVLVLAFFCIGLYEVVKSKIFDSKVRLLVLITGAVFLMLIANRTFGFGYIYPRQAIVFYPAILVLAGYGLFSLSYIMPIKYKINIVLIIVVLILVYAFESRSFREYRYQERSRFSFGYNFMTKKLSDIWTTDGQIPLIVTDKSAIRKILTNIWQDLDKLPHMYDLNATKSHEIIKKQESNTFLFLCTENEDDAICKRKVEELAKIFNMNFHFIDKKIYYEISYLDRLFPVYGLSLYKLSR